MNALRKTGFSARAVQQLALLLSLALILTVTVGASLSFLVTKTPSLYNLFVSGLNPTGDLIIRKTVEHPFGEDYVLPEGLEFTFDVDLGAENAGKTFDGRTADGNGVVAVTVSAGGASAIRGIPAGTAVTVTERPAGMGFSVKGGARREATIERDAATSVEFVNVYAPEPVRADSLSVTGVKTLVGRDWQEGDSFTFELALLEDGGWTSLGTGAVTHSLDEAGEPAPHTFDLSALLQGVSFDKAGTYSFRVTEVEGIAGGVTYDKAESYFDVLVGDADMDGYLELQSVTTSSANTQVTQDEQTGSYAVAVAFENRYAAAGSAEATISITKALEDASGQNKRPVGFTFALYDEDGELVQVSEATSAAGETSIRLVYGPEDAGKTFSYTLKESNAGETIDGVTYDASEIALWVSVVDNLDGTVSAYIYDAQGTPERSAYDAAFRNTYAPQAAEAALGGVKYLTGRTMTPGEFRFLLYQTGADFTVPAGALPVDSAVSGEEDGSFSFERLVFSTVGTYYYVVVEDASDPLGGIRYDDARYLVTIRVTDTGGALSAAVSVTDETGEESEISFTNRYAASDAVVTLSGEKTLTGMALSGGDFTFALYQATEAFEPAGTPLQSVTNDGDGAFAFAPLSFTEEGEWRYVVREDDSDPIPGVVYDKTEYRITVTVTDDGEGHLVPQVRMTALRDQEEVKAESLRFENTYIPTSEEPVTPEETTVKITVNKTVDSTGPETLGPEGFLFALTNGETGEKAVAETDKHGTAAFTLTFTGDDVGKTYHYHLVEVAGTQEGVTYSDAAYDFEVTVTLDSKGKLQASVIYNGQTVERFIAEFVNLYHSEGGGAPTNPNSNAKTGDSSNPQLWAVLLGVSGVILILLIVTGWRRKRNRRK